MALNQIYTIVNSVAKQAFGKDTITAVNEQSLIALGDYVLSSDASTNGFINTLVNQIGLNIFSYREYKSKFRSIIKSGFEWGAIVRKIKVSMPEAEEDPSYNLTDGDTIDQYKIHKPIATQKLFYEETPWMLSMTFQRTQLKEAFTSESNMGSFISAVYGEIQNKIEVAFETLGKNTINNFVAEVDGTTRAVNLLEMYNTETGKDLTVADAYHNADFLRYSVAIMKEYSDLMESMTTMFNDGSETRHTPKDMQKFFVLSMFERRLETIVQYQAFKDEYVKLDGFETIPFWQSIQSRDEIKVNRASDGTLKDIKNVVGVLFDTDALGIYKHEEEVLSSPMNAKGRYVNTFWHFKDLYFNDLSENFIVFYLA